MMPGGEEAQGRPDETANPVDTPVYCAVRDEQPVDPFPGKRQTADENPEVLRGDRVLGLVAEVADSYPRLIAWLAEGRVSSYWNVFGALISLARVIPGVQRVIWHWFFEPIARHAPWRFALRDVILQAVRYEINGCLEKINGLEKGEKGTRQVLELSGGAQVHDIQGLSAVTDVALIAQTAARDDLQKRVGNMSSGCIGVSGLSGSGKTTLIRDFCRHRYGSPVWKGEKRDHGGQDSKPSELPGLRFTVQAPLRYSAIEFLIHQYTCLCEAVLADQRLNPAGFLHRIVISILVPRSIRPAALLRGLTGVALAALSAVLFYRAVSHSWPSRSWLEQQWGWLSWVAGVAAVLAFVAVITSPTRRALAEVRQVVNLSTDARNRLERLHYQRTDTHGGGATFSAPLGAKVDLTNSHAVTEQMMTLPELVDDYRDFAERVVAALQQSIETDKSWRCWHQAPSRGPRADREGGEPAKDGDPANIDVRLVIGVDEMDRIEDTQKADEFLAELSSVFGTPHCVYLISVSPGVLATSDKRLVPPKTASSGVFDDMVWVDPLDLPTAGHLLNGRVIGLPSAFVALCYVLSGGLPRDLLRLARNVFSGEDGSGQDGSGQDRGDRRTVALPEVAAKVIADELRTLTHRALANAAPLQIPASGDLLLLLRPGYWHGVQAGNAGEPPEARHIEEAMEAVSQLWAEGRERFIGADQQVDPLAAEVCDSYLAGLYFLQTVCKLFTRYPGAATRLTTYMGTKDEGHLADNQILGGLARARIALGVNPYMAATLITETIECLRHEKEQLDLRPRAPLCFLSPLFADHTRQPAGDGSGEVPSESIGDGQAGATPPGSG